MTGNKNITRLGRVLITRVTNPTTETPFGNPFRASSTVANSNLVLANPNRFPNSRVINPVDQSSRLLSSSEFPKSNFPQPQLPQDELKHSENHNHS